MEREKDATTANPTALFQDICEMIDSSRNRVAINVNSELTLLYWHIGARINKEVLNNQRATYGGTIVSALSTQLQEQYGQDFTTRNLHRMMQFARSFPDYQIVSALSTKLPWSSFMEVLPIDSALEREFYVTMAANERWSTRKLRLQIESMVYERTLISRKPEDAIKESLSELRNGETLSPELVFKSPYFLNFTGLKGYYSEKDLENMIITGMQQFLIELGDGFSFVDRQKRIIIDGEDYYLDLLFYHRKLHRLVAIDLKKTKFKAEYKGQMELYLRWLDKYERQPGEESPLGLLLCAAGSEEQIQLLQLADSGIQVAQYYTELPEKTVLKTRLQKEIANAKLRLENVSFEEKE